MELTVAILGCGIGGAALALALQQRGIACRAYEADSSFDARRQGYGLTMQQASAALAALSVGVEGVSSRAHFTLDTNGVLQGAFGRALQAATNTETAAPSRRARKGGHSIHLPREALRAALIARLEPGTIVWGARLVALEEGVGGAGVGAGSDNVLPPWGRRVSLTFASGLRVAADVAVGCDGIFSVTRRLKLVRDPCPLRYLGVIVILGRAPSSHPLFCEHVIQMLDGCVRLYTMPFTAAETMWQLSFPLPEVEARALHDAGGGALLTAARAAVAGWRAPIPQLLGDTIESNVTGYGCYDRDVLDPVALRGGVGLSISSDSLSTPPPDAPSPTLSHVTLLGDAAHPMSPFKGQGANQAILDALALADALHVEVRRRSQYEATTAAAAAAAAVVSSLAAPPLEGQLQQRPPPIMCAGCGKASTSLGAQRAARRAAAVADDSDGGGDDGGGGGPHPPYLCTPCARLSAIARGSAVVKKRQPRKLYNAHGHIVADGVLRLMTPAECAAAGALAKRERLARNAASRAESDARGAEARASEYEALGGGACAIVRALSSYEASMLQRAETKVLQSRAVAAFLHSPAACGPQNSGTAAAARACAGMSLMGCQRSRAPLLVEGEGGCTRTTTEDLYATLSEGEVAVARAVVEQLLRGESWDPLTHRCAATGSAPTVLMSCRRGQYQT